MMRHAINWGPAGVGDTPIPGVGDFFLNPDSFPEFQDKADLDYISMSAVFTQGTAGGTSITVRLQTSFNGGLTWRDVACLQVLAVNADKACAIKKYIAAAVAAAASDGALAADTIVDGLFGDRWRLRVAIVGAYNADNKFRLNLVGLRSK